MSAVTLLSFLVSLLSAVVSILGVCVAILASKVGRLEAMHPEPRPEDVEVL